MHIELYDNGVQIRTLLTSQEVNTIINREIAIDTVNNKIYILERTAKYRRMRRIGCTDLITGVNTPVIIQLIKRVIINIIS
jgi:hypothetical protein